MERQSVFFKYITQLYILMLLIPQNLTEKNVTDIANHSIVTKISLRGINITKSGIFIDNIEIISTEFKNITEISPQLEDNSKPGKEFRLISRNEWIAQPPNVVLTDLELPATSVIIAHTASEGCTTQAQCTFRVRFIQTYHMESRHWDDIGYNFLVGGDGAVYEGRGWDKLGAHTKGYNVKSIGIAFIGMFNQIQPTEGQLDAAQLLIQEGIKLGKISKDYKLYGHRQLVPTESPGNALFEIIKKWPHFHT